MFHADQKLYMLTETRKKTNNNNNDYGDDNNDHADDDSNRNILLLSLSSSEKWSSARSLATGTRQGNLSAHSSFQPHNIARVVTVLDNELSGDAVIWQINFAVYKSSRKAFGRKVLKMSSAANFYIRLGPRSNRRKNTWPVSTPRIHQRSS